MNVKTDVLHYTESTDGLFRDLRQVEVNHRRKFARVSINGIHRSPRYLVKCTRYGNPGWDFGLENCYFNWTHFKRHCWHACITVGKRGITVSGGKNLY